VERVFVYGSLRPGREGSGLFGAAVRAAVPAVLADHALHARGLPYPFARPEPGGRVAGDLLDVDDPDGRLLARLDAYEGDDYVRARVVVETAAGPRAAWTYVAGPGVTLGADTREPSGEWRG